MIYLVWIAAWLLLDAAILVLWHIGHVQARRITPPVRRSCKPQHTINQKDAA